MRKNCFLAFPLFLTLFLLTSVAQYANATAVADIKFEVFWNTLTIKDSTGATISPPIFWEYRGLNSEAWINGPNPANPGYVYSQSPWVGIDLTHSLGNNTATLSSDLSPNNPNTLVTHTTSSSSGSGDNTGWINGNNHRGIMFDLAGLTGDYTFSFNYAVTINLTRENVSLEDASAGAGLYFHLEDDVNTPNQRISMTPLSFQGNFGANSLNYSFTASGTASFSVSLPQPWTGTNYWLEAHVNQNSLTTSTYIPEQTAEADLSVTKTSFATVTAGTNLTYDITLTNNGPDDASQVVLSEPIPAGATFVSLISPVGFTCVTPAVGSGGTVLCTTASVTSGISSIFQLLINIPPALEGSNVSNTITVTSATSDPVPSSNTSTATTTVSKANLAAIPTMTEWGMIILAILLVIGSVCHLKRRLQLKESS